MRQRSRWSWGGWTIATPGDLRENATHGILAEFIVAKALDADRKLRSGWDNFDVETASGTRVEVKSSAYLQVRVPPELAAAPPLNDPLRGADGAQLG